MTLRRGALPEAPELALRQRTEHHHAFRHARRDGRRGVADGCGTAAATAAPLHVCETQVIDAQCGREARRVAAVVGVGSEAVEALR